MQVSLSRALHHIVYPLWLVIFSVLALIPLAALRVFRPGMGLMSSLAFGITVLLGEQLWPASSSLAHGKCFMALDKRVPSASLTI